MSDKCFADLGKYCSCLKEKKCVACNFYRNDLNFDLIEKSIKLYPTLLKGAQNGK